MSEFCSNCGKETETEFNLYMVAFCAQCNQIKRRPQWTPQAFICMYCEQGYDETYPGQRVCSPCQSALVNGEY